MVSVSGEVDLAMSSHIDPWDEFNRKIASWQQEDDLVRLQMADLYYKAFQYREINPELKYELLTRGGDEARRLNEPWFALFFDDERLGTLTSDLHDFARAMPLAMDLMVHFSKPEAAVHPRRVSVLTNVLYTYLQVDPIGFQSELERGFAYLDGQISREPVSNRFVLDYRRIEYFAETERWDAAYELAHRSLELADRSGEPNMKTWHGTWRMFILCDICYALGHLDEVAAHAEGMAALSEKHDNLKRTLAAAWFWRAVAEKARGEERNASRSFHRGLRHLKILDSRDEICARAIATYYELGYDLEAAVGILDRELTAISKKGMLHRCCRVEIERCRLLSRAGIIATSDLERVWQSAAKMRVPAWYLEKLAKIEAS
jgi:hypothetical protein